MNTKTIYVELSEELVYFLKLQSYSHILSMGDAFANNEADHHAEDYYLLPLLPNDPLLKVEESEQLIHAIESGEVKEMAAGIDAIRFLVEISEDMYLRYLQDASTNLKLN